ncbi:MAG: response regulator transcription factor [Gammaproteobacteria bacterium]|nr:response regulator transcription factor [Gammaproteobacteria bacterium]
MSTAYIVDDDAAIRDALLWLFKSRAVPALAWQSAEEFIEDYSARMAGCLLLDIRMDGMTGLELFEQLQARDCRLPVIFLTGHGDVGMAVSALKRGAHDFIEKPFNDNELVNRVLIALELDARNCRERADLASVEARLQQLTERERAVMDRILAGKLNKVIADELGIAMRTVEVHRARLFEKMGVKSAVELAQRLARRS